MARLGVSCYTSTFGRVHTLNELVECFLKQDYDGPKELVILNDCVEQELVYDHPEVRIINHNERIKPLGKKFNKNIELCKYDIVACMEDDDIYLPNWLTYAVSNMRLGVFHTGNAWVEESEGEFHYSGNLFHATHVFQKQLFYSVGGYPEIDACTVDTGLMGRFREKLGNYSQPTPPHLLSYIYRWGTANCWHGSGWGPNLTNLSDAVGNIVDNQIKTKQIQSGLIELNPHWKYDYSKHFPRGMNGPLRPVT